MKKAYLFFIIFLLSISSFIYAAEKHYSKIMRIDEIKTGMKGIVRTVFEGDRIEEIELKVLGVMKNVLGAKLDIILVKLEGCRIKELGIAAGMSGSPVYIEDKLVGALAYRFGIFQKEQIAGVVPIEDIMKLEARDRKQEARSKKQEVREHQSSVISHQLFPIGTPIVFSGFNKEIIEKYNDLFQKHNLVVIQGSGGIELDEKDAQFKPGSPIALQLIKGDLSAAAVGTVTHVEDDKIFALGHPLLDLGKTDIPLAKATVLTTVPSLAASFKISAVGKDSIGSMIEDRVAGIYGVIGRKSDTLEVNVNINDVSYNYSIFKDDFFTPFLLLLSLASLISDSLYYSDEGMIKSIAKIELKDNLPLIIENYYSGGATLPPLYLQVGDEISNIFTTVLLNEFEKPQIKSIKLDLKIKPERKMAIIEDVVVDKYEVKRGERINLTIFLKPYRGKKFTKNIELMVPTDISNERLQILVSSATILDQLYKKKPTNLIQLIDILNKKRKNNNIYVKLVKDLPAAALQNQILPSLPLSILSILSSDAAAKLQIIPTSDIIEKGIETDYFIVGSKKLTIKVK